MSVNDWLAVRETDARDPDIWELWDAGSGGP
jgi:hypothetical protein